MEDFVNNLANSEDIQEVSEVVTPTVTDDMEWRFLDRCRIFVKGGDGGDGCVAFRREKGVPKGGPSGGNGGRGGHVFLVASEGDKTLARFRRCVHFEGSPGKNGLGKNCHGKNGKDRIVTVPVGTIVRDLKTGNILADLNRHGSQLQVCQGGLGGKGNFAFKTEKNKAPYFSEKGGKGISGWFQLELKLVADVGLVGVPNAGKSTLLASCTHAKPKIADYPFTTIVPNLGVVDLEDDGASFVVADIPGLLEGAHKGVGLGVAFLRHIERCHLLIHIVNGDSPDPVGDYEAIRQELMLFNPMLRNKPEIVVINKIDLSHVSSMLPNLERELKERASHCRIMAISAITGENVMHLLKKTYKILRVLERQSFQEYRRGNLIENGIDVKQEDNETTVENIKPKEWRVYGKRIQRIAEMTNWKYYEAIERFHRILQVTGTTKALESAGAVTGDKVWIGDISFGFYPQENIYYSMAVADDKLSTLCIQQHASKDLLSNQLEQVLQTVCERYRLDSNSFVELASNILSHILVRHPERCSETLARVLSAQGNFLLLPSFCLSVQHKLEQSQSHPLYLSFIGLLRLYRSEKETSFPRQYPVSLGTSDQLLWYDPKVIEAVLKEERELHDANKCERLPWKAVLVFASEQLEELVYETFCSIIQTEGDTTITLSVYDRLFLAFCLKEFPLIFQRTLHRVYHEQPTLFVQLIPAANLPPILEQIAYESISTELFTVIQKHMEELYELVEIIEQDSSLLWKLDDWLASIEKLAVFSCFQDFSSTVVWDQLKTISLDTLFVFFSYCHDGILKEGCIPFLSFRVGFCYAFLLLYVVQVYGYEERWLDFLVNDISKGLTLVMVPMSSLYHRN
eukprot:jgi/Galph1/5198/GphlegSOOS_G3892.1